MRPGALLSIAVLGVAALTSCGDVELRSHYRQADIVVDGKYDDWDGQLTWVEQANMSVGTQNDGSDLYVIVVIGDREVQRSIMMSGMFLWFDPAGERDKQFGIHYPLGLRDPAQFMRPDRGGGGDPDKLREEFEKTSLAEVELIGVGGAVRMTEAPDDLPGVSVAVKRERGAMVVEYRIPLMATVDSPYGVGASPGASIGVGLMTPEIDMSKMREQMRERMGDRGGDDGGGMGGGRGGGGMGGGRGGMGGGPRGAARAEPPEPINLWARIVLADVPKN